LRILINEFEIKGAKQQDRGHCHKAQGAGRRIDVTFEGGTLLP